MKTWAEVNLKVEDTLEGANCYQHLHGTISGMHAGIMEIMAYMLIDRAEKTGKTEGEIMAQLFIEVAKTKTHMATGHVTSDTTDISELMKALDKLKKDGGPKDD